MTPPIALGWKDGLKAVIDPAGATLARLQAPLRAGWTDLILPAPPEAASDASYCGRLIGRYAGRIANGRFRLDGRDYQLPQNLGSHHLHGGPLGFQTRRWTPVAVERSGVKRSVVLRLVSPDGEAGYPGELTVTATFSLTAQALSLDIEATCDAPTPVNLTLHPYFNLAGCGDIGEHQLRIFADTSLSVDQDLVPTGGETPLSGDADFREAARLGPRLNGDDAMIQRLGGLDHSYVLTNGAPAAELTSPSGEITLRLTTNQAILQVYSGQGFGRPDALHPGLALEPQAAPDAVNHPGFADPILRPGQTYRHRSLYEFLS